MFQKWIFQMCNEIGCKLPVSNSIKWSVRIEPGMGRQGDFLTVAEQHEV